MHDEAILIARLLLGIPFIIWGFMKLRGGEAKLEPMLTSLGLPDAKALAYMVGFCEFIGGVGVVLGYPIVTFSVALGLWCLVTGYMSHRNDINQLLSHVAMAGGYFALAAAGSGTIALFGGTPSGIWAMVP